MYNKVNQEINKDKTLKHVCEEDARYHVLYYDSQGVHRTEPKCEINKKNLNLKLNVKGIQLNDEEMFNIRNWIIKT